jgi:hypothetical protein
LPLLCLGCRRWQSRNSPLMPIPAQHFSRFAMTRIGAHWQIAPDTPIRTLEPARLRHGPEDDSSVLSPNILTIFRFPSWFLCAAVYRTSERTRKWPKRRSQTYGFGSPRCASGLPGMEGIFLRGNSVAIRLGRQELGFGSGRLISPAEGLNLHRSMDGASSGKDRQSHLSLGPSST